MNQSHWLRHLSLSISCHVSLSLPLSLSLPPHFFFISLSLFISSLSLLVAFVLHPGVDGPAGAQTEMMTPWAGGWWVERASSLASIGFLKLSETKHTSALLPHTCHFGTPLELIFSPNRNKFTGGFSPTDPDPTQTTVSAFSALWKRRTSGADNRFAFKRRCKEHP